MSHKPKHRKMPANYQLKPSAEYEADCQRKRDQEVVRWACTLLTVVMSALFVLGVATVIINHN